MATLSGNKIKDTYQSLVKFSDNGNITVGAKQLTDGFGNNSPIFVSTTQVGIGVTPESGLNLHVYGDAKIGSNLTVIGNLVVEGNTTTVGTDTLTVKDPLIVLANNNTSTDAVDIGFYGKYTPSGTTLYSGLFREALTGKYRLFKGLEDEPTTTVNTGGTGYAVASLVANLEGNVTGNLIGSVTGGTFSGTLLSNVVATTQSANDNSTKVATTAYVDNQVGLYDTLSEVLANGNTTGGTDIAVSAGDDITFTDTSKSIYGTGSELEIHHNGSNSYITEDGTGALYLQGTYMYLTKSDGSQNYIELDLDGATDSRVKLNYGGATKLQTTNTGVDITGNIDFTGNINIGDNQKILFGDSGDVEMFFNGSTFVIDDTSEVQQGIDIDTNRVRFRGTDLYVELGNAQHTFWTNGTERFKINATEVKVSHQLNVTGDLIVDTDTLFVDSTNSQVGINNASPSGFTGQYSKDLIIGDGTGDRGITIYSSSSAYGSLFFKDAEGSSTGNGGFIAYNHFVDGMEFGIGNAGLGAGSLSIGSTSIFMNKKLIVDATYSTTNTLTVDPSNVRVGIFNDSPSYRLDVAGDARFTGQTIISGDLAVDTDTLFVDVSEDSVGIGLTNPADYTADELVISVPDGSGMTLVSGTTDTAYIAFADATSQLNNYIGFDHDTDTMSINNFGGDINFSVGEAINKMTINSSGITFDDEIISNSYATIQSHINIDATVAGDPYISFQQDGTQRASISYDDTEEAFRISTDEFFIKTGSPRVKALTVDSSQNVGIGTDSPTHLLTLEETDTNSVQLVIDNNNTSDAGTETSTIRFRHYRSYVAGLNDAGEITVGKEEAWDASGDRNSYMSFSTRLGANGVQERMRIDSSGNVGIGTDLPNRQLSIYGTNDGYMSFDGGRTGNHEFVVGSEASGFIIYDDTIDTYRFVIDQDSGNVGIGTTNPQFGLSMAQGTGDGNRIGWNDGAGDKRASIICSGSTDALQFHTGTSDTERMRITSGGTIEIRNGGTNGGEIKLTGADNDLTINGARGQIKLQINGTNAYEVDSVQLYPSADNSKNLGTSFLRWSTVYAVNGINTSDETLKENIKECDLGIDFIDSLKPKSYNFKDLKEDNDAYGKKRYGLIAQDILQTELKDSVFGKKDGEYGLSYNDLIAPMIKAIQELKAEIELLKTQINN